MKYKINYDYKVWDVIVFMFLNTILLLITFGIATPFVLLNFIKLITKDLEVVEKENGKWEHVGTKEEIPGKML